MSVIARRRIQHSTETIGLLIDQCDLVELPPEHAELLLKFVPTKEEVTKIYCFAYNIIINNKNVYTKDRRFVYLLTYRAEIQRHNYRVA